MSTSTDFSIQQLMDAGVHFGHRKNFWNPKMSKYIYGVRNGIHIIDLQKTYYLLCRTLAVLRQVAQNKGKVLFVGTKNQASDIVAQEATRSGQYYVNHRWLGGMLTNWKTVSASIKTLTSYENSLASPDIEITKKEKIGIERKRKKLDSFLGGIRDMGGRPDILFVVDTRVESIAILEAKKLNIPVIAIIDTNSSLEGIDYPIPGNDDSRKAIALYASLVANALIDGGAQSKDPVDSKPVAPVAKTPVDAPKVEQAILPAAQESQQAGASIAQTDSKTQSVVVPVAVTAKEST